jgi:3D (Asp-Asp-Asp) domain-containing protein
MTTIKLTRYFMLNQNDYGNNNIIPILDNSGNVITNVDPHLFAEGSLEGCFKLNDGRVLNVTGNYVPAPEQVSQALKDIADKEYRGRYGFVGLSKDCSHYFTYSVSPTTWGVGAKNKALYPFISIAADPAFYPFGTILFCPALKDKRLPDGEDHMGYLMVDDVGSAIVGQNHCDFFTGTKQWADQLTWLPENVEIEVYSTPK